MSLRLPGPAARARNRGPTKRCNIAGSIDGKLSEGQNDEDLRSPIRDGRCHPGTGDGYMTLKPGDLIYTGAMPPIPGMRRGMSVGDQVEVDVEGIGTMRNTVVGMRANTSR